MEYFPKPQQFYFGQAKEKKILTNLLKSSHGQRAKETLQMWG